LPAVLVTFQIGPEQRAKYCVDRHRPVARSSFERVVGQVPSSHACHATLSKTS
jgi:hypothetical protein